MLRRTFTARRMRAVAAAGVAAFALAGALVQSSSAGEAVTSSLSTCPATAAYGHFPHPNCLLRPWTQNEGVPISGTVTVTKTGKKLGGWFYLFTVTTNVPDPGGNICPAGAVPFALIPCHYAGASAQIIGQSVHGSTTLATSTATSLDNAACSGAGPCVRHYEIGASLSYGRLTFVVQVLQGDVTKAANDLGDAGFERAITVTVPHYTGKPPKCLAAGTC